MFKPPVVELHSSNIADGWTFPATAAQGWMVCLQSGAETTYTDNVGTRKTWTDPLEALRWMSAFPLGREGRWVGYLSYDFGQWPEKSFRPESKNDLELPLFVFSFHGRGIAAEWHSQGTGAAAMQSTFNRDSWISAANRAIEYIRAGDVFQINLSQRLTLGLTEQPAEIWKRLKHQSPPPFGALLDYGKFALLSLSPELFLQVQNRRVLTRPIKGTRPLLPGMDQQLLASTKDQAELNMIVDLERNDLGRICEIGSVKVIEPRHIEAHGTVYHGVAGIAGTLREEVDFVELLRAVFPSGSVTGAPKIRAMQIIDELEPVKRGPYCGAIGYLDGDGAMQFNVAIRTMIFQNGKVHLPVGAGIVADSDPAAEYEETLVKARGMLNALGRPHFK